MLTTPNYLDVEIGNDGLLPHIEKVDSDGSIDAAIVRGGFDRLPSEEQQLVLNGPEYSQYGPANIDQKFANTILALLVPDLYEVRAFYAERAATAMPDYVVDEATDVLTIDKQRDPGQKSYAHIDMPLGIYGADGSEQVRAVSSLSLGSGTGSTLFLAKRLNSFADPTDLLHRFMMEYLSEESVKLIEDSGVIHREGWAMRQCPGDVVVIPQFDRPAVHQVEPEANRSSHVFSTFITTRFEAYNNSPQGQVQPYLPRTSTRR